MPSDAIPPGPPVALSTQTPGPRRTAARPGCDVLIRPSGGALVVTADGWDHLLTPRLAVRVPVGLPFAVTVLSGGPAAVLELSPDASAQVGWLGAGGLLRDLLAHLETARSAAVRERAEAVLRDAAEPVLVRVVDVGVPDDPRLAAILAGLRADPGAPHRLTDWAARTGAGARTLTRICTDVTGAGFTDWRATVRVACSAYRLAAGDGVAAVARGVGYASTGAYVAAFRRRVGVSPAEYRRSGGLGIAGPIEDRNGPHAVRPWSA